MRSTRPNLLTVDAPRAARGIVLLALLLALALLGICLMGAMDMWTIARQREREKELLFIGDQYRKAIGHYYLGAPPGTGRALPPSLSALLDDERYPVPVHHLRRAYADPVTGKQEWGELRINDSIIGVYSLSEAQPLKQANFPPAYTQFVEAATYRDWIFAYRLPRGRPGIPAAAASTPSGGRIPSNPSTPIRRTQP